jgi:uncharacterized protein YkwD
MRLHLRIVLTAALVLAAAAPSDAADRRPAARADLAGDVLAAINAYREANGVPPLVAASPLAALAGRHSEDMLERGFYAHDAPDGSTFDTRVGGFLEAEGYRDWHAGENIAALLGDPGPEAVLQLWLDSPPHHANMLDPHVKAVGVGVARVDAGVGVWAGTGPVTAVTAIFGPPQPVLRSSALVTAVAGTVLVRLPGQRALRPLRGTELVPVGAEVDVAAGRVRLTSAADDGGGVQTADFFAGRFVLGYLDDFPGTTPPRVVTNLRLSLALTCPAAKKQAARRPAGAEAPKPKPAKRRLWGSGKGAFRVSATYASATVRGTEWLTEDACDSTLVRVRSGIVDVYDARLRRHVLVPAGKSYLARR